MKDKKLNLPKPSAEETEQIKKMILEKYDVVIPKADLTKIAALIKELGWWLEHKREPNSPIRITEQTAIEFKDLLKEVRGIDIPISEAYDEVRSLLGMTEYKEKERLSREIRAILVTHMSIPRDKAVEEKTIKLFLLQYGIELTQSQVEQIVQYLTRILWYEVGLNELLGKCLDDLLIYADKVKRGKRRVNIKTLHLE